MKDRGERFTSKPIQVTSYQESISYHIPTLPPQKTLSSLALKPP